MKLYSKASVVVYKILAYITFAEFLAMLLIVFYQVLCRYIFKSPTNWMQESVLILFIWMTMTSSAMAVRSYEHVNVTAILKRIPGKKGVAFSLISETFSAIFFFVLFCSGITMVINFVETVTPILDISLSVPYTAFIVGGVFSIFFEIEIIANKLRVLKGELDLKDYLGGKRGV